LPGSRASLGFRKIESNPILRQYKEEGLRFLKYRHLRRLYESRNITPEIFFEQLALDQLASSDPQPQLL